MDSKQLGTVLAVAAAVLLALLVGVYKPDGTTPPGAPSQDGYVFCFWNVENLFDDVDDGRRAKGDREYDGFFANDKEMLKQKLKNLTDVLLGINGGKGPDILCVAETESDRAVELLQESLNSRLTDDSLKYNTRLFKEVRVGRHIAPAILTRLPVDRDETHLLDKKSRILEGHVTVADRQLVVIASHWTSRVTDSSEEGTGRGHYADKIYGRFKAMYKSNPKVDLLVCGDFNDNPDNDSVVSHLHATDDADAVRRSDEPLLFNPFALLYKDGEASHYYGRKAYLFDQVCLSPGLLDDEGWSYVDGSAKVVKQMDDGKGHPLRFGGEKDKRPLESRGASDHFPVTVTLKVK